jgi:hypothetical protein
MDRGLPTQEAHRQAVCALAIPTRSGSTCGAIVRPYGGPYTARSSLADEDTRVYRDRTPPSSVLTTSRRGSAFHDREQWRVAGDEWLGASPSRDSPDDGCPRFRPVAVAVNVWMEKDGRSPFRVVGGRRWQHRSGGVAVRGKTRDMECQPDIRPETFRP